MRLPIPIGTLVRRKDPSCKFNRYYGEVYNHSGMCYLVKLKMDSYKSTLGVPDLLLAWFHDLVEWAEPMKPHWEV